MDNAVIIMTATINVGSCAGLYLRDKQQREDQYLLALDKYLNAGLKVVFAENSLSDLGFIEKRFGKPPLLEAITFDGNHMTHVCGKGQGENETITYALQHSTFLANELFFFKVSGRYFSSEIAETIRQFDTKLYDGIFELIPITKQAAMS